MSRVYGSVDLLQGQPLVGDGECVTLVKRYAHLGSTATWRAGKKVWGTPLFQKVPLLPLFLMGDGLAGVQVIMLHSIWGRINEGSGLWISGERRSESKNINSDRKAEQTLTVRIPAPAVMLKHFM